MEQITLYYREGASDKIYQAAIEAADGGYVVNFAYGRRGATLTTGTKTTGPVLIDEARKLYNKLVREKAAKGYTPGEDGVPYRQAGKDSKVTGIHCHFLNHVTEDQSRALLANPSWCAQEKFDGRRFLIRKEGSAITGINRLGLAVAVPEPIAAAAEAIAADFIMDGEAVGDHLYVFDLLALNGTDTRTLSYGDRYCQLLELIDPKSPRAIRLVPTAFLPEQKREFVQRLRAAGREGVVFKRLDARYTAGRPTNGGPQLKLKFTESASFIVSKVNGKRSVSLMVFDGEQKVPVGNVTIPPNHDVPPVGDIVDVRFLYAYRGGSIFQPVYLGVRDDIRAEECVIGQLKYKSEPATGS